MAGIGASIKSLVLVSFFSILLIAMIISNYYVSQSFADKSDTNTNQTQAGRQQDFSTCVDNAMNKISNGYFNFSDPDPISHCFDLLLKGKMANGNSTNNNGGGNNGNNLENNSTFSNV
jgi:hypothetical protein